MNFTETPIVFDQIKKEYKNVKALNGISFKVKKGEIFGFLGPNGAGKSTALNILIGTLKPSSGESYILGEISSKLDMLTKKKIGVVFENNNLYKRLTGRENLHFFSDLYDINYTKTEKLLDFFDLTSAANRQVKNYSKGMRQRLLIARALLNDPEILILDEPTSGLDPQSVELIHQAIEDFSKERKTVLLSTHFMAEADRLCDEIAFINEGKIITIKPPSELKNIYGSKVIEINLRFSKNIEKLKKIVPESSIKSTNNNLKVELSIKEEKLGKLIDQIRKEYEILNIHSREASLHQVFLKLSS